MTNRSIAWMLVSSALVVWSAVPAGAQDPSGREVAAALKLKNVAPAPRLPDGHPDLGNGKGSWAAPSVGNMGGGKAGAYGGDAPPEHVVDVPMLPWAKAIYEQRLAGKDVQDPEAYCILPGHPRYAATFFPFQIYQTADRIIFLYEKLTSWRVVYMDRTEHTPPNKWNVNFQGESIGHWDGDTLVIDVVGNNDRTWLDGAGHPKTEKLHLIERWHRVNALIMHYEVTIDDPGAYTKPWTNSWNMVFKPGMELLDYVCENNESILNRLTPEKPPEKSDKAPEKAKP